MTQMTIDQAMELGRRHHQARQLSEAAGIYQQVLSAVPGHVDAMQLLGLVALDTDRPDSAAELFTRALAIQPDSADLHYNLGVARMFLRQVEQAAESFRQATVLRPDLLGAQANLAAALITLGRFDEALLATRAALAIDPHHGDSHNNLGVVLKETGKMEEAVPAFEQAVRLEPRFVHAWTNLAGTLQKLGRHPAAAEAYRQAIRLTPANPELHHSLGRVLADIPDLEAARQAFESAIRLRPDYPDAHTNLANVLHSAGRYDEAVAISRRAIALAPDAPLPKYNLSLMLLTQGHFDEGWRLHESRFDCPELGMTRFNFGRPTWDGSDLGGRTILLNSEQGMGDTIQCVRYVPLIRARGGRIVLGCHRELVLLMERVEGIEKVVWDVDPSLEFDVSCTLLSLPMLFGTTEATIPSKVPYLSANPEETATWESRLPTGVRRIGLVWAGRPGHGNDRNRSMALSEYAPLARVSDVWFISLQKGDAAAQARQPPPGLTITDWTDDLTDFAATAALVENLDLVITVDTSVAHLSGALGRPTWLLLPRVPDWRWMLDRTDSPWYPTMRIFRQKRAGDWAGVMEEVARALL